SETGGGQFVVELSVDQVHLAKVWLVRVEADARAVLDRRALVRVAFDAEAGEQADHAIIRLAHRVFRAAADRCHHSGHRGGFRMLGTRWWGGRQERPAAWGARR